MYDIDKCLDELRERLKNPDYLNVNSLSNPEGIQICCYNAADEMKVRHFIKQIMSDTTIPYHLIENNLYEIFLSYCRDEKILDLLESTEEREGTKKLQEYIENYINSEIYVDMICKKHPKQGDVILITGVGDVFPFMRIHNLLEGLQNKIIDIPIIVMYPCSYYGNSVKLFDKLKANYNYRPINTFNMMMQGGNL